jgi:hypothetical protein
VEEECEGLGQVINRQRDKGRMQVGEKKEKKQKKKKKRSK